jgi:hypothetical protein
MDAARKAVMARSAITAEGVTLAQTLLVKTVLLVLGSGLIMSAFGIWLVRGTADAPGLSLIKLGVSLFMLILGMCFVVIAKSSPPKPL